MQRLNSRVVCRFPQLKVIYDTKYPSTGMCFCQLKPTALINRKERHLKGLPLYFYN